MIMQVMPKQPFEAIQYTGDNADDVVEFGAGAFITSSEGRLCKNTGEPIDEGAWIVEVDWNEQEDLFTSLLMTDEYFREHFAPLPLVIRSMDLTDEQKQKLRAYADAETCRCQAMGEY